MSIETGTRTTTARDRRGELLEHLSTIAPFDTKLLPPRQRAGSIARPGLTRRMDQGEEIILLRAPAGYGKTTLLAQFVTAQPRVAWLTVTRDDDDVMGFVAYLVRALDGLDPLTGDALAALLSPGADPDTVLLPRLGRLLRSMPDPLTLVLDDIHVLADDQSLRVIEVLVSHLPEGSRLVLSGRSTPGIERGRLRTQVNVLELGPADLALNPGEGQELLRRAGLATDAATAERIVDEAEGWPAGIYITGLAGRRESRTAVIGSVHQPLVDEYLQEQVIGGLAEDTVEFLTRTAVLEELDPVACDALLERDDSASMLAHLAESHLFVIPLGAHGEGYRYHRLFADALRHELRRREPALEPVLHARASSMFEARNQPGQAIRHAVSAGDTARAAALVWLCTAPMLGIGRGTTVSRWLGWFTDADFDRHPDLSIARAWCSVTARQPAPLGPWTDIARRHDLTTVLADGTPLGSALALLDAVTGLDGLTRMVDAADRSLALDAEVRATSSLAHYLAGAALILLGRVEEGRPRLEHAVNSGGEVIAPISLSLADLALLAIEEGKWVEAEHLVDRALALADHYRVLEQPLQVTVPAVAALVAAHGGDAVEARRRISQAHRLLANLGEQAPWIPAKASILLGRAELALGDPAAARQHADESALLLQRLPDSGTLPDALRDLTRQIDRSEGKAQGVVVPLTTAELRVLCYLPTHLSYQGIAEDLFVSRNTIKTQAISIYRKLRVSSRQAAVARARELGLLDDLG